MATQGWFGHYRLDRLLGRGGMGEVWVAYDGQTDRHVALKVLPQHLAADQQYRGRFMREAQLAARLQEPHIVPIHHFGQIGGQLYIDMALVEGADLQSILDREGRLAPARALDIVSQTADALDSAHRAGLIHRDVKPSNILIHPTGFVYLIDFGIAVSTEQAASRYTQTGLAIGSYAYMAPERFDGQVTPSGDVYGLACVLYECLSGEPPFGRTTPHRQMYGHAAAPRPRLSSTRSGLPPALDDVIARGMAVDPGQRFGTAGQLARAAADTMAPPTMQQFTGLSASKRPQLPVLIGGLVALLVLAGLGAVAVTVLHDGGDGRGPTPPVAAVEVALLGDGVRVGKPDAPKTIDMFNEPICPQCGRFVKSYEPEIAAAIDAGHVAVRYHLLNFLDGQSSSGDYSTRAVAAVQCIGKFDHAEVFTTFYGKLFEPTFQPEEGGRRDHSDLELSRVAAESGASDAAVSCIADGDRHTTAASAAEDGFTLLEQLRGKGKGSTPAVYDGRTEIDTSVSGWVADLAK